MDGVEVDFKIPHNDIWLMDEEEYKEEYKLCEAHYKQDVKMQKLRVNEKKQLEERIKKMQEQIKKDKEHLLLLKQGWKELDYARADLKDRMNVFEERERCDAALKRIKTPINKFLLTQQ